MTSVPMDADVDAALGVAHAGVGASMRVLLDQVADHDRQQLWTVYGARSEEAYLATRLGVLYRTARLWVRTAHAISRRRELGDRLAAGTLSFDQLVALVDIAAVDDPTIVEPLGPFDDVGDGGTPFGAGTDGGSAGGGSADGESAGGLFDDASADEPGAPGGPFGTGPAAANSDGGSADPPASGRDASTVGLLDLADSLSVSQLAGEAVRRRRRTDEEARDRYRRRELRASMIGEGHLRLSGDLYDDQAATVHAALMDYAGRAPKNPDTGGWEPLTARFADGLADMCDAYLAGRATATSKPAMIIHTSATVLTDAGEHWAHTEDGTGLSAATTRRMACFAEMLLSFDDEDGNPLYLGRSHRFPTWQLAAAVLRRDGACRFPGCDRTQFLHIHHVKEWEKDKGPTDYDNLAPLCSRHHHVVHEGGWTITGNACGPLTFTNPEHTIVLTSNPRRPHPPPPRKPPPQRE